MRQGSNEVMVCSSLSSKDCVASVLASINDSHREQAPLSVSFRIKCDLIHQPWQDSATTVYSPWTAKSDQITRAASVSQSKHWRGKTNICNVKLHYQLSNTLLTYNVPQSPFQMQ